MQDELSPWLFFSLSQKFFVLRGLLSFSFLWFPAYPKRPQMRNIYFFYYFKFSWVTKLFVSIRLGVLTLLFYLVNLFIFFYVCWCFILHYANGSLGNLSLSFLVVLDTGSDLFWIPCDGQKNGCVKALQSSSGAVCYFLLLWIFGFFVISFITSIWYGYMGSFFFLCCCSHICLKTS